MNQKHLHIHKNYVYMDSSEQQTDLKQIMDQLDVSGLSYIDSSSSEESNQMDDQQAFKNQQNKNDHTHSKRKVSKRLCHTKSDQFLLRDRYLVDLQNIIKESHQKLSKQTPLLLAATDKQILENLQKRTKNYGYFLKALQVDKKYTQIISLKTQKLKAQNQRKKAILSTQKQKSTLRSQETEMRKYVLDKRMKQQIVIDKIEKHAYKLGMQRIRNEQKQVKTQVQQIQKTNNLKVTNLDIRQRNQINQLREELEGIRQTNRVNKVDLKRTLKSMQVDNINGKKFIVSKTQSLKQKRFVV